MYFDSLWVMGGLWGVVGVLMAVLTVVVHVLFALAVFRDADALAGEGKQLVLAQSGSWAAATLIGGVFVATA